MKKVVVISLGGSLIVPEKINHNFLNNFKKTISKHFKTHQFVLVCGGGFIARRYIEALVAEKKSKIEIAKTGILATRTNARFVMELFGKLANKNLPLSLIQIKNELQKSNVVICGALRYEKNATSDTTAAEVAHFLKTDFINMTDVEGLYSENPKTNPKAKFIPKISWKDFEKKALNLSYHAGQHFVLDQQAAVLIKKNKTRTYIIGQNLKNLSNLVTGKKFKGTIIEN